MHRSEYFELKAVASTRNVYWTRSWGKRKKIMTKAIDVGIQKVNTLNENATLNSLRIMIKLHLHMYGMRNHIKHIQQVQLVTETQRIHERLTKGRRREEKMKRLTKRKSLDIHDRI